MSEVLRSATLHSLVVGPFQCNCAVLVCSKTQEAVIIDAGDEADRIEKKLKSLGVSVKYSLHTHAHLDHIGAVKGLKSARPDCKVAVHAEDVPLYEMLVDQGRLFGLHYETPPPVDHRLTDSETIRFGELELEVLHTPGHSPGGVCFSLKGGALMDEPVLFTGDTLFKQSIGRTDRWGADHSMLLKSIRQRIFRLDEQTQLRPGHGPTSSIGLEKRQNPFLI
jgi:hydroxyacylglutathione hydrolase